MTSDAEAVSNLVKDGSTQLFGSHFFHFSKPELSARLRSAGFNTEFSLLAGPARSEPANEHTATFIAALILNMFCSMLRG